MHRPHTGNEENDYDFFASLRRELTGIQIVGDDLFATNAERLEKGVKIQSANGILMKINQIGTITEALDTASLTRGNNYAVTVSVRSIQLIPLSRISRWKLGRSN